MLSAILKHGVALIRRIRLENWRSHRATELTFSKGTNLLVGPMGAGKTSVVEAVCFALYGTFPALRRKEVELDAVITRGEKSAAVELEFELDGRSYSVRREFGRESKARLEIDGRLVIEQPKRVTEELERALRADYEVFARAIYAEQNGIDELLRLSPKERKKRVDEILGILFFERAGDGAGQVARKIKERSEELAARLAELKAEELEVEVDALKRELAEAKEEEKRLDEELRRLGDVAEAKQARVRELERKEKEVRELREELERKRGELLGMKVERPVSEDELARLERELKEVTAKLRNAAERRRRAEADKNAASRALWEVERRYEELTAQLNRKRELEKKKGALGVTYAVALSEIKGARDRIEKSRAWLAMQSSVLSDLRGIMAELARQGTTCPVCGGPLTEEKRQHLLEEKKKLKEHIEETVAQKEEEIKLQERELENLEKNARILQEIEAELSRLAVTQEEVEKVEKAKDEAQRAEREAAAMAEQAEAEENELRHSQIRLSQAVMEAKKALNERARAERLRKEVSELEAELAEKAFDERELKEAREDAQRVMLAMVELKEKISGKRSVEEEKEKRLELLQGRIAEAQELRREAEMAARAAERVAAWENALRATQAALREVYIAEINGALGLIWRQIYPHADFTEARMRVGEEDYSLELKAGSEWIPVEGRVSGGERACAALALRIAFATVLVPNLSWLFLDEPTHNLDAEGVAALARALREEIPKAKVEQIIVITHDERLRAAASGQLYVLSRDKATGGASVAEAARELALI
ncbi:MAG: SMC family ATPase [Candidatus Micrarchaeia archaeon]